MKILDLIHIKVDDIIDLNEYESTDLLDTLFRYEFANNSLEISGLTLSSNPKIKDQGIDAIITKPLPIGLDYLPSGISVFQFKASKSSFDVKKEFCKRSKETDEWHLKPLIKKFLEQKATYVLINTKEVWNIAQKEKLRNKIKNQLKEIDNKLEFPIEIYSADDIARWCDKYPIFRLQFNKLAHAKKFAEWKDEIQKNVITDTITTDTIKSLMCDLLNKIRTSEGKVQTFRIVGDQGIGKKTFLVETLDKLPPNKKSNIIIMDSKVNKIENISNALFYFNVSSGILVFLNCSDKHHNEICDKLNVSQMKDFVLITLNSQLYFEESKIYKGTELIEIPRWNEKDIEELLKKIDPSIPHHIKSQIIKYSQGIPDFIISIYIMLKSEDYEIYKSDSIDAFCESIIEFLIKDSGFDRAILTRVLVGFSLFSYLGWNIADCKELSPEGTFEYKFKENKEKFSWILELDKHLYEIEEIVTYLLKVRILRLRGRFIYITPRPLAIHLLRNYTMESKVIEYFEKIRSLNDHHFLNRFLERLEDFAVEDIGKKIVNSILHSPSFNNWRKINDKEISEILLRLSIINNKLVGEKLKELFKDVDYDALKNELTSRRDLIYSLEHIIWFDDSFEDGINILLKLAIAENETYANNATGTFRDKFSIYLPGTSASLQDRIIYLENLNESDDEMVIDQVLNSLPMVFNLEQHSRMVYAELQGLKPLPEEYYPKSGTEIQEYLKRGFKILEKNLKSPNTEIQKISYNILSNNFITFLDLNLWEVIKEYWSEYIKIEQNNKFEILNIIERKVRFEKSKFENFKSQIKKGLEDNNYESNIQNQFIVDIIKEVLKQIEDNDGKQDKSEKEHRYDDLIDEKLISSQRDYTQLEEFQEEIKNSFTLLDEIKWALLNIDNWYIKGLNYEEHLKTQAKEIVQKIHTNPSHLEEALSFLITNERYIIYFVGEAFTKLDPTYEKWDLIKQIFINDKINRKSEFIIGYLTNYRLNDPIKYNELIDEIKKEEGLSRDLFDFAIRKELDEWSIDLIIELFENKIINDLDLLKFANPHRVKSLDKQLFKKLITFYFKNVKDPLNVQRGSMGDHLLIINDYLKDHKDIIPEIKVLLLNIITSFEHFESEEIIESDPPLRIPRHINLSRLWSEVVILIIEECPDILDPVRNKIIEHLHKLPTLVSQPDVQLLFLKFLEIDKEGTWEVFITKFISDPKIRQLFQFYFNFDFLSEIPEDWIIKLCKKDPENFPQVIAQMIDERIRGFESPPSLIVRLIEEFYDNKKFKNKLIHSFEKGVRMYLPGRSAGVVHSYIKILEKWKNGISSQRFLNWINEANDYLTNESKRAKMWDEEVLEPPQDLVEQDEFYDREKWINSIKEKYIGETIAFTNIDGNWKLLVHSSDEDELYEELSKLYEEAKIDKKYKIRFRKF